MSAVLAAREGDASVDRPDGPPAQPYHGDPLARQARKASQGLSVTVEGPEDAPTCLLLHGVGTTSWMWRGLVDRIVGALRVVTVDLPGHGRSASRPWVSMAETVTAVVRTISDVAPDGAAHLIGLSLGGYVALDAAATHPGTVPSVIASGVNVLPFPRPRLMRAAGHLMAPFIGSGVMLRVNARALGVPSEDYERYAAAARSMAKGTLATVGGELMDYRVPLTAASSTTRVLALAGSNEHPLILQSLSRIAGEFPHGQARVAPAVGHAWNGQAPDLFAQTVLAHITSQALPTELIAAD